MIGLRRDEISGTHGLLDPKYGRVYGHLALFFEFCFLLSSEAFEFIADREQQNDSLDGLGDHIKKLTMQ
jgi:hypothetical protein